jgi:DNA-binding transcriptional LysR family regulator
MPLQPFGYIYTAMLNVTFRRIQVFLAIVEEGSFSAAAKRLDIAQPSISGHIVALEREIGGLVFRRQRGRAAELTEIGRSLLGRVKNIMLEATEIKADLDQSRRDEARSIIFACQRSLANFMLRSDLIMFARTNPTLQLSVDIGQQDEALKLVKAGVADLCCFLGDDKSTELPSEVIGEDRLIIIASVAHPLVGRRNLGPEDLRAHPFVLPPKGSFYGSTVLNLLAASGVAPVKVVAQASEFQFLREMVLADVGLSCVLSQNVAADLGAGTVARLDFNPPNFAVDIRMALSQKRQITPSIATFASFLRSRKYGSSLRLKRSP